MRKLKCWSCDKVVLELATGSRVAKGLELMCKACAEIDPATPSECEVSENQSGVDYLKNLFNSFCKK
jgi:phage FluMu protein Com